MFKLPREGRQLNPFGSKLRVRCGGNVRMNGRACSLVRSSAVRVCTVPIRGLGMTVCFLCGAVRPLTAHRGRMCGQSLYWNLWVTFYAGVRAVQRLTWAAQALYLVRIRVYACMYGDRHVQPERCTYHRE